MEEQKKSARRVRLNTMQLVALGFFGVIFLGGVLLWLPFSNQKPIEFIDALFTSVTSVCVTGLVTIVPADQFTVAGKIILVILHPHSEAQNRKSRASPRFPYKTDGTGGHFAL